MKRGFTLIELLIVVAYWNSGVLLLLLNANSCQVARCQSDMKTVPPLWGCIVWTKAITALAA